MNIQDINKLPPQATEIEAAIIGALILSSNRFEEVAAIIKPEMFYVDTNHLIYSAIVEMIKQGRAVDLLTVSNQLRDKLKPGEIIELTRNVVSDVHIVHHSKIIAQKYLQRQLILAANKMQLEAYRDTDPDEITAIWESFEQEVNDITAGANKGTSTEIALNEAYLEIKNDHEIIKAGKMPGIASGFNSLDELTGGFRSGQLIVVGARPGMGKTSLAIYFARNAAKAGKNVLFFSLEMLRTDLLKIVIAAETNLNRSAIRDGKLNPYDFTQIDNSFSHIKNLPIQWVDIPNVSTAQIKGIAKHRAKRTGLDMIIVDYLQLIKSNGKPQFREQEVATISRDLKALSLLLQIPIIVNSQLNRLAENERPKLSHLRESGSIEQDADIVLLPWRPGYAGFKDENGLPISENKGELIIAKNRRGARGRITFYDAGQMLNFTE